MPWLALGELPLPKKALPARLSVYVFLVLAIIVSIWFSSTTTRPWSKALLGCVIVLLGLPNLAPGYWVCPVDLPPFFSSAAYRHYLAPGETVLVLPFGWQSDGMLWQASTDMYFNQAGARKALSCSPASGTPAMLYRPIVPIRFSVARGAAQLRSESRAATRR